VSFDDVWGQEQAVGYLRRALASGRLAQALLFVGPAGVGRRRTARELAKALLCLHPQSKHRPRRGPEAERQHAEACDVCQACRQVEGGNHPRYFELGRTAGKGVVAVDPLREFLKPMARRLAEGEWRVFVIDDAERFGWVGYNTVLKRLEEPPARNVVILVTQNLDSLPATVVSRGQVVRFQRLAPAVLERVLVERVGVSRTTVRHVLPLAGGSLEPAAGNLEAWIAERQWVVAAVARMTPAEVVAVGKELIARASARREAPAEAQEPAGGRAVAGGKEAAEGEEPGADEEATVGGKVTTAERNLQVVELLRPALWLYRDALVWRATGNETLLSGAAPVGVVRELAERVSREGLEKSLAELLRAQVELKLLNPALQLAAVLVELVRQRYERAIPVAGR
jgi:DNA polymerase-3 subunit delta'